MQKKSKYQVAIIGGGLAGLTLAIQMADAGLSCILFEKKKYPFHKVCGEYVSMESWSFLERCGLNLSALNLPVINRLAVSSPSGKFLEHKLDLGGFGISRFQLDSKLAAIAKEKGVVLLEECKVNDVKFSEGQFKIDSAEGIFYSEICAGAWGKKSNLDAKLSGTVTEENDSTKNYVGIKYHVRLNFPADRIELHNFEDGYCGISKIEDQKYCLCYLTNAGNLKKSGADIKRMEEQIVMKNPFLKKYFSEAEFLFAEPLAISQIKIGYKGAVKNNILMLGDTAGNIAPLSGNGMSMAMRSSFALAQLIARYFEGKMNRQQIENSYAKFWRQQFKKRIKLSSFLQSLLKNTSLTNFTISLLRVFPPLKKAVIRSTHGEPF